MINDGNGKPSFFAVRLGSPIIAGFTTVTPPSGCDTDGGVCYIPVNNKQDTSSPAFQSIALDGDPGRFVVIAHFRLKVHKSATNFVKSFLTCRSNCINLGNGDAAVSDSRMLIENIDVRSGASFNNVGGAVVWVVEKDVGTAILDVRYTGAYTARTVSFYTDSNGEPAVLAFRCPGYCSLEQEATVTGTTVLPVDSSSSNIQEVTAPSTGSYLAFSNYRIRHDPGSDQHGFVRMAFWDANGEGEPLMVTEGMQPSGNGFINWGGAAAAVVQGQAGQKISTRYVSEQSPANQWRFYNDVNGVPVLLIVELPGVSSPATSTQIPAGPIAKDSWTDLAQLASP